MWDLTGSVGLESSITPPNTPDDGKWHLVGANMFNDGTDRKGQVFADLAFDSIQTNATNFGDGISEFNIGARKSTSSSFVGDIRDVRVYNRLKTDAGIFHHQDPATRWDLYYQPQRRTYFFGVVSVPSTISDYRFRQRFFG